VKQVESVELPGTACGTTRALRIVTWRGGAGPRAYLQAALHADEVPPLLVAHHLERELDALDAQQAILGEVVLVPFANPLGLDQFIGGSHLGRFDLDSGANFNRGYPQLAAALAARLDGRLDADLHANGALLRDELAALLHETQPRATLRALQHALYARAIGCDLVLDLHCDFEAELHLYLPAAHWPTAADLAAALDARVVLLTDDSGGAAFDEACGNLYAELARRFPMHPLPRPLAATVELRGERDVDDALARQDAQGLLRFLAARGVLAADAPPPADGRTGETLATPLEAVDVVHAPATGVIVYERALGEVIGAGEAIGSIVVPGAAQRVPLRARSAGRLFARRGQRWARAGQMVAKIAGREPLPWRHSGALLYD